MRKAHDQLPGQTKRGRKRGTTLTVDKKREAREIYQEIGGTITTRLYYGVAEIRRFMMKNGIAGHSDLSKRLSVDNLASNATDFHGKDISWCSSLDNVLLWVDPSTGAFFNGRQHPREQMGDNVQPIASDHDIRDWIARPVMALTRQKAAARQQGKHGNEGGRGKRKGPTGQISGPNDTTIVVNVKKRETPT